MATHQTGMSAPATKSLMQMGQDILPLILDTLQAPRASINGLNALLTFLFIFRNISERLRYFTEIQRMKLIVELKLNMSEGFTLGAVYV